MSTLGDIINRFRSETRDHPRICSAEAVGDGVSLYFQIPDYPIVEDSLWCKLQTNGGTPVDEIHWTLDNDSGQFHLVGSWLTTPPDDTMKLLWSWAHTKWSDKDIIRFANAAVRYIGQEYLVEVEDDTLETEEGIIEYAVPAGAKRITQIDLRQDDDSPWLSCRHWKTKMNAGVPRIKFYGNMGAMQMRVTYVASVTPFVEVEYEEGLEPEDWPGLLNQELASTGLPEQAYEALLWYVIWIAYEARLTMRSRDDAVQHSKDESTVTMRDLETRAARIKTIFDLHYGHFQTEFIHGRLTQ